MAERLRADAAEYEQVRQLTEQVRTYEMRLQRAAEAFYVHARIRESTYQTTAAQLEAMIAQSRAELRRLALARTIAVLPEDAVT